MRMTKLFLSMAALSSFFVISSVRAADHPMDTATVSDQCVGSGTYGAYNNEPYSPPAVREVLAPTKENQARYGGDVGESSLNKSYGGSAADRNIEKYEPYPSDYTRYDRLNPYKLEHPSENFGD